MHKNRFNLVVFIISLIAVTVAFTRLIYPFVINATMAAVLVILFRPLYKKLIERFPKKKYRIALLVTLIVLFIVIIPLAFAGYSIAVQSPVFINWSIKKVQLIQEMTMHHPIFIRLQSVPEFLNIIQVVSNIGSELTNVVLSTTQNTFMSASRFAIDFVFIMVFFFFFMADGRLLVDKIKQILPVARSMEEHVFKRLESVIDATIRGNLIIAVIEGVFGGLLVFVYGFPSPILLACIMAILSFIPLVGINFVVVPLGIFRMISGHVLSGLSMILISLFLVSISQNILKPKLVGDRSGLHPLMVLIATLGGLSWFGLVGFVIGPIIAVLFITSWDIFAHEFIRHQNTSGNT